ncbi:SDR family NAD(P)-dependent oxidoreductase [Chitinibacter sp. SCUT-21]|uniref:SDR family NAD(P)-dependent oxidoreductase n=1 Tax=Chitinibacter sp. SCUT-21 TaxID=2970891 RepID=UPI0035A6A410
MSKKVAIVGYSFRFPGVSTENYWQQLLDEQNLVTEVQAGRWAQEMYRHPDKNTPGTSYTFAAGSIGDVSGFDAGFFGISPREAAMMDPQQRILLEMSWEAFEHAGKKPSAMRGSNCGVYVGFASVDYAYRMADDLAALDSAAATGNTGSIAANRISYIFDLRGPSMAIDTACSSSLVAFHQACQAIRAGEIDMALAGGVSLHLHPYGFVIFSKATMLSRKGRCNVFDEAGDGYVRSEGGGIILLKDYDKAIADGDRILAVVAGSGVNTDGKKNGLTIPSHIAQAELLTRTYTQAGISADDIDYLEAHGTGTAVGDPIETRAIGTALGQLRDKNNPLPIGSVKSNMGHLETASGIAGLVKALNIVQKRTVPATIGIKRLNPKIDFASLNIKVVTKAQPLKKDGQITVGVNSFGFGGANAHVILQSHVATQLTAEPKAKTAIKQPNYPLRISARNEVALKAFAQALVDDIEEHEASASLYDYTYTLLNHREHFDYCATTFVQSFAEMKSALKAIAGDNPAKQLITTGNAVSKPLGPVFIFSGNGSQWHGMGQTLLRESAVFKQTLQEIDTYFKPLAGWSILEHFKEATAEQRYEYTEIAQPALFALQVGIVQVLAQLGIKPQAVAGHSVGEVAAAWCSGALSLKDASYVIYNRSHWQGTTKGQGQMTAVGLSAEQVSQYLRELKLDDVIAIAGANSDRGATIAGANCHLDIIEKTLAEKSIFFKRLDLDYAFHSEAMNPIEKDVIKSLADLSPQASRIPFYSTVTGALLDGSQLDATYWWHNIRQPVQFAPASQALIEAGFNVFTEIGPHPVLRSYLSDALKSSQAIGAVIPTLQRKDERLEHILACAHKIIIAGCESAWNHQYPVAGQLLDLPHYPWQRETLWHEVTSESQGLLQRKSLHPLLGHSHTQFANTWENRLDVATQTIFADHVVGEATVFPGTGYVEMALAAAAVQMPDLTVFELEELEILTPLILSDNQIKVCRTQQIGVDGALQIQARSYASDSADWSVHAKVRIRPEPSHTRLDQAPSLTVPTQQPLFNAQSHALLTKMAGLSYGPAFSCIKHGWVSEQTVLAELIAPPAITEDLDHYLLHPALLDCTFQLIIQLLRDDVAQQAGVAFIPTKIGHVTFSKECGPITYVQAKLVQRAPHSLTAEFTLYDADGGVIALIEEARFRSVRLHKEQQKPLHLLDYTTEAAPLSHHKRAATFERLATQLQNQAAQTPETTLLINEVDPLLDALASQANYELLLTTTESGILPESPSLASVEALQRYNEALALATHDGIVSINIDGQQQLNSPHEGLCSQAIWQTVLADYPDYFQLAHAIDLTAQSGKAQIAENFPALKLPKRSYAELWQAALGTRQQLIAKLIASSLEQELSTLPEGQRLSVLESSGANSICAQQIIPLLQNPNFDFTLQTTSAEVAANLQALQEQQTNFNIELHPDSATHHRVFDLALISLNFSDQSDFDQALESAIERLAPGGLLLLIGRENSSWITFTQGTKPHTTIEYATQYLIDKGLQINTAEITPDQSSDLVFVSASKSQQASNPGAELPLVYVVGSAVELPADFIGTLKDNCTALFITKLEELSDAFTNAPQANTHIIVTEGLFAQTSDPISALKKQNARCRAVAQVHQLLEQHQWVSTLWLPTIAASSHLLADGAHAEQSSDSALWGFGRTLQNESNTAEVRLIDCLSSLTTAEIATCLLDEIRANDAETEVIYTGIGKRFVTRLRYTEMPNTESSAPDASANQIHRLGFQFPGQLRNLQWEQSDLGELADDQLDIAIKATGLNFRDVMYTLGLLSDEAVENGFAGPSLGLEFAGEVRRVGSKVNGYNVGDLVVGFGPYSFADRVYTTPSAIALIPEGISCEAAATIPSVFFTVYYGLHYLARLQAGERILIHGAAGGVGIAAIQLARHLGAEIYATAGSDEKRLFLQNLGVEHIYDSRSLVFADEILRDTQGQGVDVVLNSLAGEAVNRNFDVLRPFGRFLELGKRDFYENTKIGLRPFRNNITYFGIDADQLMQVKPELTHRLFGEVIRLFADGTLTPLPYQVFDASEVVDAFRNMQQARQIGKIIVTYHNGLPAVTTTQPQANNRVLKFDPNACYLVTGGLNGFGLETAKWLANKGAKHLILLSRRGAATPEAETAVALLKAQGVTAEALKCDVTDFAALQTIFASFGKTRPPLKGIVHAAVVIDDGLIRNLDSAQIERVLAPKMLGVDYLDQLSRASAIDFFVLYSSGTTLFGNPGQASYVAANCYLESVAAARRANGLPATCVRWGAIDDVGFLARNEKIKDALQSRMGGQALNSASALAELEKMILTGASDLGVLELDWKALERFLPSAASPKFKRVARQAGESAQSDDAGETIAQLIATLSDDELHTTFVDMLKTEVGGILRIAPEKIDANGSLYDMGLDSLMGVELVVALEERFGTRLPIMALSQNPTLTKLAEKLIQQLKGSQVEQISDTESRIQLLAAQHGATEQTDSAALAAQLVNTAGSARIIK